MKKLLPIPKEMISEVYLMPRSEDRRSGDSRTAQEMEGQIRKMYLALEGRIGRSIDARERIVA